jgi:hypothetical protein
MNENSGILIEDLEVWLAGMLSALNDKKNVIRREEMRRIFEAWRSSGPNVKKLFRENPDLGAYVPDEHGAGPTWRAIPYLEGSGIRVVVEPPLSPNRMMSREELSQDHTRRIFMRFLMNPLRDQILGPCARTNCGRYFRRRRKADTKYCSRECAQLQAGANSADKRRREERKKKLDVAMRLAQEWITTRTKEDWKQWISKHPKGKNKGITPKFLTRAVTHDVLKPPTKGR